MFRRDGREGDRIAVPDDVPYLVCTAYTNFGVVPRQDRHPVECGLAEHDGSICLDGDAEADCMQGIHQFGIHLERWFGACQDGPGAAEAANPRQFRDLVRRQAVANWKLSGKRGAGLRAPQPAVCKTDEDGRDPRMHALALKGVEHICDRV